MSESKSLPRVMPVAIHVGVTEEHVDAGEATYAERTVNVRKLPLGKAAQLGLAFRSVPAKIKELREGGELAEFFANEKIDNLPLQDVALELVNFLPEVLSSAADIIIDILAVGTEIEPEELREVGLDEATELFVAVVTVNNLNAVQANVKNALRILGITRDPAPEEQAEEAI